MTIQIEPGLDLDRRVAEALGWHRGSVDAEAACCWFDDRGLFRYRVAWFQPSTDLNAAFAAAERAFDSRLLPTPDEIERVNPIERRWVVNRLTDEEGKAEGYECRLEYFDDRDYYSHSWESIGDPGIEGQAKTACLAICAAILKLKEPQNDPQ